MGIELDWVTFIGLLAVAGLLGAIVHSTLQQWGTKPDQEVHLTSEVPVERGYTVIPPEPSAANRSMEKHLELVSYMNKLLSKETERLQDGLRESHNETD